MTLEFEMPQKAAGLLAEATKMWIMTPENKQIDEELHQGACDAYKYLIKMGHGLLAEASVMVVGVVMESYEDAANYDTILMQSLNESAAQGAPEPDPQTLKAVNHLEACLNLSEAGE